LTVDGADTILSAIDNRLGDVSRALALGLLLVSGRARADDAYPPPSDVQQALDRLNRGFLIDPTQGYQHSPAEAELGRLLFFDPRLSATGGMSCATCHDPARAWRDGRARAIGVHGQTLPRRSMSLLATSQFHRGFFWDGRAQTLEEAALTALQARLEMNADEGAVLRALSRIPDYARRFDEIYGPEGATPRDVSRALAAFVSEDVKMGESPFDRLRRDPRALDASAQRGLILFMGKARCGACHYGPDLSDSFYHNTGLAPTRGDEDLGRYAYAPFPENLRAFKTVPLRDVALTGPYMHDGRFKTLPEVVEFYDRGGDAPDKDPQMRPLGLTAAEKRDLLAFLASLTAPVVPVARPTLPQPAPPAEPGEAIGAARRRVASLVFFLERRDRTGLGASAELAAEQLQAARRMPAAAALASRLERSASVARRIADVAGTASWESLEILARDAQGDVSYAAQRWSGLGEAASTDASDLPRIDAVLKRLRGEFDGLRCAPGAADGGCSAPLSELVGKVAALHVPQEDLAPDPRLLEDLQAYYQVRALAADDPSACAPLESLQKRYEGIVHTGDWSCRQWYLGVRALKSLVVKDGRYLGLCQTSLSLDYPDIPVADRDRLCAVIQDTSMSTEELCGLLTGKFLDRYSGDACRNLFTLVAPSQSGGELLFRFDPDEIFTLHQGFSLFRAAYRGKDVAACGSSDLCRALMGDSRGVLQAHESRARTAACAALSRWTAADATAEASPILDRMQDVLGLAESRRVPSDLSAAREIDRLEEEVSRLRQSAGACRQAYSGPPAGQKPKT